MAFITLKEWHIYRYSRPFKSSMRDGLIVELKDIKGRVGFGEIAPLPGFSTETLAQAEGELKENILPFFREKTFDEKEVLSRLALFSPSLQFGIETALLDLSSPCMASPLPLSSLIQGTKEEMREELKRSHLSTVKLKFFPFSGKEAREVALFLLPYLQNKKVRIDTNRGWSLEEALLFARTFPDHLLEYYEEPLRSFEDYTRFPYPVACDETGREKSIEKVLDIPHLKALVIKPTLVGGLSKLKHCATLCLKKEIDFILSSSYESEIGIMQIVKLFFRLHLPIKAMGLDTSRTFATPLTCQPLMQERGYLHIPTRWSLNKDLVNERFRMSP